MIDLLFKHLGEGRRQGRKPINKQIRLDESFKNIVLNYKNIPKRSPNDPMKVQRRSNEGPMKVQGRSKAGPRRLASAVSSPWTRRLLGRPQVAFVLRPPRRLYFLNVVWSFVGRLLVVFWSFVGRF